MRGSTVFFAVVALLPLAAAAPASEPVTLRWNAHRADVLAVAFAPAGDRIATAGQDGIVCIWDAGSGKELRRFEDCFNVWSLAFSPDGQNLAIPDRNDVQIFDVASGLPRRRFEGHVGQVWNVAFTPNGTLLATASEDGTVRLWDTATGRERRRLDEHRYGAWSLAVSGDGRRVASGASHGLVCVWETETGHLVKRFRAYHGGGVWPLSISRDGRMVATAEYGVGAVRLWETASGQERRRFATSAESLGILAASGHILTLGKEGRFAWYQPGHEPAHFRGENPRWAFRCFALSNDGRRVAGGTSDGDMHVWSVAPPREPPVPPPPAWSERECDALWSVLAADDAEPAYRAVGTLLGAPEAATNLLKARLRAAPRPIPEPAAVVRLIRDLDDDRFRVREEASRRLEQLGARIIHWLEKAHGDQPSPETRRRLQLLLDILEEPTLTAEELRSLRAIEVLEAIGSREARAVLEPLVSEGSDDPLTIDGRETLRRMRRITARAKH